MNDFDPPNYAEFSYEKKSEGKNKLSRILLVLGYIAFISLFFLVCYLTRLIPVFAVAPIFLWMLIFFTWRLVSYDMYFEFKSGTLSLGRVKEKKTGRIKKELLSLSVQNAREICPYTKDLSLAKEKRVYDFSSAPSSDKCILIRFDQGGTPCAVIFEGTARIGRLLTAFSPNAHDLKGKDFHG